MRAEIPHTNLTDRIQHIGGKMIRPGETRMVDPSLVGRGKAPAAAAAAEGTGPDPQDVEMLASKNVSAVAAALPELDASALDRLEALESAGAGRKGVLEAIAVERLARAGAGAD